MPKKLHIALVLDKSSSMSATRDHTISGFNEQVAQIKLNAKDAPYETTVTLITFNGDVFEHLLMAPVDQLEEADPSFYKCEGMTAMFDGMGYAVRKISEAMGPEDDALIITISDGDENSSKHYKAASLKEMLDGLQATKRWTISYMGCDASILYKVAQQTGIPVSNMASWSNQSAGSSKRAMTGTAKAIDRYMKGKFSDIQLDDDFYIPTRPDGDRSKEVFMDFGASADGSVANLSNAVTNQDATTARYLSFDGVLRSMSQSLRVQTDVSSASNVQPVIDRPEDLELRVGTSNVFGTGAKAIW